MTEPYRIEVHLTEREVELLRLIAEGATDPEAARAMALSTTVVSHAASILRKKLGLKNRTHLSAWGGAHGFFEPTLPVEVRMAAPNETQKKVRDLKWHIRELESALVHYAQADSWLPTNLDYGRLTRYAGGGHDGYSRAREVLGWE